MKQSEPENSTISSILAATFPFFNNSSLIKQDSLNSVDDMIPKKEIKHVWHKLDSNLFDGFNIDFDINALIFEPTTN